MKNRSEIKNGLGKERHRELGKRLSEMSAELQTITVEVSHFYGTSGRPSRMGIRVGKALAELRSALDEKFAQELTSKELADGQWKHVYFGGIEKPQGEPESIVGNNFQKPAK